MRVLAGSESLAGTRIPTAPNSNRRDQVCAHVHEWDRLCYPEEGFGRECGLWGESSNKNVLLKQLPESALCMSAFSPILYTS